MTTVRAALAEPALAGASTCWRRRQGRRSTSTAAPRCSSSPRAARTSASWQPRRRPWARRVVVSDRSGVAASFRASEAIVVPYDRDATSLRSPGCCATRNSAGVSPTARCARLRARRGTPCCALNSPCTPRRSTASVAASATARARRRARRPRRDSRCSARSPKCASARVSARPAPRRSSGSAARRAIAAPAACRVVSGDDPRRSRPSTSRSKAAPTRSERTSGRPHAAAR